VVAIVTQYLKIICIAEEAVDILVPIRVAVQRYNGDHVIYPHAYISLGILLTHLRFTEHAARLTLIPYSRTLRRHSLTR
jgi:hypothetical protein